MKFWLLIYIILNVCPPPCCAQTPTATAYTDSLLTHTLLTDKEISAYAQNKIPEYYKKQSWDTLEAIARYWGRQCVITQPLFSFCTLYALRNHTYSQKNLTHLYIGGDTLTCPKPAIIYLKEYETLSHPLATTGWINGDVNYEYLSFLKELATKLLRDTTLKGDALAMAQFYAAPTHAQFQHMDNHMPDSNSVTGYYDTQYGAKPPAGLHLCLINGAWTPTGTLGKLLTRYNLGGTIGFKTGRLTADFEFTARIGNKTQNGYTVLYHDTAFAATFNSGAYLGADVAFAIFQSHKSAVELLGGLALDLCAFSFDNPDIVNTYKALNLNFGLGYRFFLHRVSNSHMERYSYLAIQVKYNYLNYNFEDQVNLAGNAYTINLLYGLYRRSRNSIYKSNYK